MPDSWSDHIIEPGPDSPVAVLSLAWLAQLRTVMAAHEASKELNALLVSRLVACEAERDYLRYAMTRIHNGEPVLSRNDWATVQRPTIEVSDD